jgi:hypothetical protein
MFLRIFTTRTNEHIKSIRANTNDNKKIIDDQSNCSYDLCPIIRTKAILIRQAGNINTIVVRTASSSKTRRKLLVYFLLYTYLKLN